MTEWKKCPDFDLAPLKYFDPKTFNWETPDKDFKNLCAFIVTLALIYNDFKDLAWWQKQLDDCPPNPNEKSSYFGQHNGMKTHISRLVVGLYDELLIFIKENQRVLESKLFQEILGRISARYRNDWKKLVNESSNKEDLEILAELRANGVFHYQMNGVFSGYKNYFIKPENPLNEKAYYSFGENILKTRFYFADAAVQGYVKKFGDSRIEYLLAEINTSLKRIVEAGIECLSAKYLTA